MKNVGESFEFDEFADFYGAELADTPEVVSFEVGDHEKLSIFFDGGLEFASEPTVFVVVRMPGAGSFDRAREESAFCEVKEAFGGGGEYEAVVLVNKSSMRSGGVLVPGFVELPGVAGEASLVGIGEADLIDIAGCDIFLCSLQHFQPGIF